MTISNPEACTYGKTYFYAPDFLVGDFLNNGGDFSDPAVLHFDGAVPTNGVVLTNLNPAGLTAKIGYNICDSGNANVLGSIGIGGGMALGLASNGTDPNIHAPSGAFFVAHNASPRFVINDGGFIALYTSPAMAEDTTYAVQITLTLPDAPVGGFYSLTTRLEVPAAGIDHTEVISGWLGSGAGLLNLFINGPISPSAPSSMDVQYLYIVGQSLAESCTGGRPTTSNLLPSATSKISHARILVEHRGEGGAEVFHNLMKERSS